MAFASHKRHHVAPVETGERFVLVAEFGRAKRVRPMPLAAASRLLIGRMQLAVARTFFALLDARLGGPLRRRRRPAARVAGERI